MAKQANKDDEKQWHFRLAVDNGEVIDVFLPDELYQEFTEELSDAIKHKGIFYVGWEHTIVEFHNLYLKQIDASRIVGWRCD